MLHNITVRIVLKTWPKRKSGVYPINICVTHERKRKYYGYQFGINYKCTEKEFESIMSQRAQGQNREVRNHLQGIRQSIIDSIKKVKHFEFSFEEMEKVAFPNRSTKNEIELVKALRQYANRSKKTSTKGLYRGTANHVLKFDKNVTFSKVNYKWLNKLEKYLSRIGNSHSTVMIHMRNIRTVYNAAVSQGVANGNKYPFGKGAEKYLITKSTESKKLTSLADVRFLLNFSSSNPDLQFARDMYIFSFFCGGANARDVFALTHKNILHDVIEFRRVKTNGIVLIEIPLVKSLTDIINRYNQSGYIFGVLEDGLKESTITSRTRNTRKAINEGLRKILGNSITMHEARHSFSTYARSCGMSEGMIGNFLGHSSNSVTGGYISYEIGEKRKMILEVEKYVKNE